MTPLMRRTLPVVVVCALALCVGVIAASRLFPAVDRMTTAAITKGNFTEDLSDEWLTGALEALAQGDLQTMRSNARKLRRSPLDRTIVDWAMARSGMAGIRSNEIARAMETLDGWPDARRIRRNHERAIVRERKRQPARLVAAFGEGQPETLTAIIALARAHMKLGDDDAAHALLAPAWHTESIKAATERSILSEFEEILTPEDHRKRFLAMMYRDRIRSAERVAKLAGTESWVKPWAAVIRKRSDAGKLLDKADKDFKASPHHLYARVTRLRRMERDAQAAKLLLQSPETESELVDPDRWWTERRIVSRDALERGEAETAYKIAAMHTGGSAKTRIDAAFHAGWYALRGLDDPQKAIDHFAAIEMAATGSISKARGAYWLGRAHEAAGSGDADMHYRRAARYQSAYYGQLARHRLGLGLTGLHRPSLTREDMRRFRSHDAVAAMHRLEQIGATELAHDMATGLGRVMEAPAEIAQLVAHLERQGQAAGGAADRQGGKLARHRDGRPDASGRRDPRLGALVGAGTSPRLCRGAPGKRIQCRGPLARQRAWPDAAAARDSARSGARKRDRLRSRPAGFRRRLQCGAGHCLSERATGPL